MYWLETEYLSGDYSESKWALHKVDGEKDEIILWKAYEDTPGYDPEDVEKSWKAIEDYIKEELGFIPDYEVN